MKKNYSEKIRSYLQIPIVLLMMFFANSSSLFAQNPLTSAQDFNIFTEGDLSITAGDIEGAIAVGGNLVVKGNAQRTANNATGGQPYVSISGIKYALVVGGGLTGLNGGNIFKVDGKNSLTDDHYVRFSSLSGSSAVANGGGIDIGNPPTATSTQYVRVNSTIQSASSVQNSTSLVNFSTAFTDFRTQATTMAGCAGNVTATLLTGQATLNLNSTSTNVWNVSGSALNTYSQINLTGNLPSASNPLVINVDAAGTFSWSNVKIVVGSQSDNYLETSIAPYVIWNFYNTTSLAITNSNLIIGSVFAPNASVTYTASGNITGQVVAKSFTKPNAGELHIAKFNGNITCAACCACTGNLISNPGFESGLTSWDNWGNTTILTSPVYSGSKSATIASGLQGGAGQSFNVTAGKIYSVTAFAKVLSGTGWADIDISFYNSSWQKIGVESYTQVTSTSWQKYNVSAIAPAGAVYATVGFWKDANGQLYLDDFCVTPNSGLALGNTVWLDKNDNGLQDAGEPGVGQIIVTVYQDNNNDGVADAGFTPVVTTTNDNGEYIVSNLAAGSYFVTIGDQTWFYKSTINGGDPDNNIDKDNNGITQNTTTHTISTLPVTLSSSTEPDGTGAVNTNYNATCDLGIWKDNGLGDFVFLDANGNGIQDAGETGIEGVTVKLKTTSGTVLATTTTDANGYYYFYDPAQYGTTTYNVQFVTPSGYSPSSPNQGTDDTKDSDPVNGVAANISVPYGTWNHTVDAGFVPLILKLGNYVWNDQNNNGVQDNGEPGINGATVKLYADANADNIPDGAALATTTTDANGLYSFAGIAPGKYIVGVTLPSGYVAGTTTSTSALPDNDDNTDNNGVTMVNGEVRSNYITLVAGAEPTTDGDGNNGNLTLDFGLKGTGSIGDKVWNDANGNGIQDGGEAGISDVTVTLTYSGGATVTATTDANGNYLFANLAPGIYTVSFTTPSGYVAAPANQGGDDTKDSDPVSGTVSVTLTANENNLTVDAGFMSNQLVIGNYVWADVNNNGIQDAGEPGINGVTVKLYTDANGDNLPDGAVVASTVTSASGVYTFTGLTPGNYIVGVAVPSGYVAGTATATSASPNNDNNTDNNGVNTVGGEVRSNFITITTGAEPTTDGDGNNGNLTLDFGLRGTLSLGNIVWADLNDNGIYDTNESGINGVTVNLYFDANGDNQPDDLNGDNAITAVDVILSTTTASGGTYQFNYLTPGNYIAGIVMPSGYVPGAGTASATPNNDVDNDDNGVVLAGNELRSNYITLTTGGEPTTDGDGSNGNLTLDFGITPSGSDQMFSISGNLFYDANRLTDNTVNGFNITPYPTEYVLLVNATTGKVDAIQQLPAVLSANEGTFSFTNLQGGNTYYVMLSKDYVAVGSTAPVNASLPSYYYPTGEHIGSSAGSDGTIDSKSAWIYLNRNVTDVNFGIVYVRPGNVD